MYFICNKERPLSLYKAFWDSKWSTLREGKGVLGASKAWRFAVFSWCFYNGFLRSLTHQCFGDSFPEFGTGSTPLMGRKFG